MDVLVPIGIVVAELAVLAWVIRWGWRRHVRLTDAAPPPDRDAAVERMRQRQINATVSRWHDDLETWDGRLP